MQTIKQGNVIDILPTLPDQSVQCVVTSPPYWGLRDYGVDGQLGLEATPEEYVAKMVEVFREVRRVLRDDGTLWLNLGDSYRPSGDLGVGGSSKQRSNAGSNNVVRKCSAPGLKPKDLVGIPWRLAFALQADGWYLRSDIIWAKGLSFCDSYSGSVMPESVTDRPTKGHEYLFLLTKSPRYYYDADAVREASIGVHANRTKDNPAGSEDSKRHSERKEAPGSGKSFGVAYCNPKGRNLRSVWAINPQPFSEAHFATFPMALVEPCIKAGSRKGDTVLDPFAGSGTTGCVALKHGREFIGIELNSQYAQMASEQIEGPLFVQAPVAVREESE